MTQLIENRSFAQIKEVRTDQDKNAAVAQGYATVYNSWYPVYGGPEKGGWNERIMPGACKKSLMEKADVRFLLNHEGLPLARTKSGTLALIEDDIGLFSESSLDLNNPKVQEAVSVMSRGDADQMSFAFRAIRQEWNEDYTERTITECALVDVSLVTYPANPETIMSLRDQILKDAESRATPKPQAPVSTPNLDALRKLV